MQSGRDAQTPEPVELRDASKAPMRFSVNGSTPAYNGQSGSIPQYASHKNMTDTQVSLIAAYACDLLAIA